MTQETLGVAWCKGGDPEDGGWSFDDGGAVNGYDVAYKATSREAALGLGIPEAVLDRFEKDDGDYTDGGLFDWLQDHSGLFRT
jgi:hypothetical protein